MKTEVERFIEPENQKLLWELIHLCPIIEMLPQPELWFSSIIEEVYEKALQNTTEVIPLLQLNEFALFQMLIELKEVSEQLKKNTQPEVNMHDITMNKQQQEVVNWVVKDNQFRADTTKDEPIRNMDDLLLEQKRLRDNDIPSLPKPNGERAIDV